MVVVVVVVLCVCVGGSTYPCLYMMKSAGEYSSPMMTFSYHVTLKVTIKLTTVSLTTINSMQFNSMHSANY